MTTPTVVPITPVALSGSAVGPWDTVWAFGAAVDVTVWIKRAGLAAEQVDAGDLTVTGTETLTNGGAVQIAADVVPDDGWETGDYAYLVRATPTGQATDMAGSERVNLAIIEKAIDRVARQGQDLKATVGRALLVPLGESGFMVDTSGAEDDDFVLWDGAGFKFVDAADLDLQGPKGDPGGGGGAIGLFNDIASLTIPEGTDMVQVTGRAEVGDGAVGKFLIRVQEGWAALDSDIEDEAGAAWRWADGQDFCPEMFEDDAEANALSAFRQMHDLVNFYGGGHCVGRSGAVYLFPHTATTPTTFASRTFTRRDGKTCTHSFIGRGVGEPRDPQLAGVAFYSFDGRGCTLQMDGDFNLTAADYQSGYRKRDTRIVWDIWKSANVELKNFTWDGGWGEQTTDTGASGECWSYCIRLTGVAGCEISHVVARNGAQDFVVTAHRNKASLDGIALVSTEAYPEPDASTADVHDPAGICHSLVVRSCVVDHFRRQGLSPVGCGFRDLAQDYPGLAIEDSIVSNIGRYPGAAPRWFTGDPTDGSVKWQWRGFPPRSAVDFEPVRVAGYQVTDNVFRNCNFIDCIGSFAASTGSWRRARVEQSLDFSAVDVTANTFTRAGMTLPRTRLNGIPAKIRICTSGTLPGGLELNTDYYLSKVSDTVFKLCATPADAIAGTPINITTQGSGTHSFIWHDTPPNVGKITFDGCTLRHPADGSVLPMQVNCEHLRVVNCDIHVAAGSAFLGPNAVYDERQTWENNRITFVRGGFDVDNYSFINSQSLDGGEMDASTDTLTLAVDDGLGKFEYVPLKLRISGSGSPALPTGLTQGPTYWMTRTGPLTRKFSTTLENARNGIYINITGAGSGLLTYYRDIAQYDVMGNSFEQLPRLLEFDASQVSTVTGRIPIPTMPYRREGVSDSEHFEVLAVTTGATLPTGFDALTTYYAFMDYEDYSGVYLAATSADAIAHIPVIPTVAGTGKCRLGATVTQALIDVLDANCRFTDNTITLDMNAAVANGVMVRMAGLNGLYGGNQFTQKGGSALVPTVSHARLSIDRANVLKDGFSNAGP